MLAVIVVDDHDKPVGYFTPELLARLAQLPLVTYNAPALSVEEAASRLKSSELRVILDGPIIRAKSDDAHHLFIGEDTALGETCSRLTKQEVGVAVIVDRLGRFDGMITRFAIEARVIGKLIKGK